MKFLFGKCILLAAILVAGGCAPKNQIIEEDGVFDPIEPINRNIYGFNKKVDFFVLRPMALSYEKFFPRPFKAPLSNVLSNLGESKNVVNHVLQKNGDNAVRSTARLVFNSTLGVFGLFDVADKMGIEEQSTDFGATIRAYSFAWSGRQPGYLVLPIFGPSSLHDTIGVYGDAIVYPVKYVESNALKFAIAVLAVSKARADFISSEELLESSLDEYSFVRDFYEETRQKGTIDNDLWGNPENIWDK